MSKQITRRDAILGGLGLLTGGAAVAALLPENVSTVLADHARQIRDLQSAQRVGLNQLRSVRQVNSASPSVFNAPEYGTVGNTWLDDNGLAGTGYPTLTMVTPSKVLVIIGYLPWNVANAAGYRTSAMSAHVKVDADTSFSSQFNNNTTQAVNATQYASRPLELTPGSHTFTIGASWDDDVPAAGILPELMDSYLIVIPLSAA